MRTTENDDVRKGNLKNRKRRNYRVLVVFIETSDQCQHHCSRFHIIHFQSSLERYLCLSKICNENAMTNHESSRRDQPSDSK
mmetsp:Transcript_10467/g.21792  ORF Transcript_10467/g.21792 Transcript_10467/m.21792 type:complete len:82 (-) Transcript_10467:244-489(-)